MNHEEAIALIRQCSVIAQRLIVDLHEREPGNQTFTQNGLLDGQEIVCDSLSHGELGIALEHLLYMIHEADIAFDIDRVKQLHTLAEQFGIKNHYTALNLKQLGLSTAYNVPPA